MFLLFVHCTDMLQTCRGKNCYDWTMEGQTYNLLDLFRLYFDIIVSSSTVFFMTVGRAWKIFIWCHIQSSWEDQHNCRRSGMFSWVNMSWNRRTTWMLITLWMWFLVLVAISFLYRIFRLSTLGSEFIFEAISFRG